MQRSVFIFRLFVLFLLALAIGRYEAAPANAQSGALRYIFVIPMSHLDIGFNFSVPEVIELQKQYQDEAMDYAEQYPAYRWAIESVWQLDQWVEQTDDPAQIQRMRNLIGQGKIEVMAGYANMHQGLMNSEQFNRFLYPARVYEEEWGLDLDTAISDDVPGSSWALPQVLAANGVNNLIAGINISFGGLPEIPVSDYLFNWQGPDGSEVLTWISKEGYGEGLFTYCLPCNYEHMTSRTQKMVDFYEENGYAYDSVIAMIGFDNDGSDTVIGAFDNIAQWNQEHTWPQIIVATPDDFFRHVRQKYGDDGFNTYTGDWSGLWESNDTSTPVSTAENRWVKETAPQAETLAAIALGMEEAFLYPAEQLDQIYRDTLVFDEHSGPGGGYYLTAEQIEDSNVWFRERVVQSVEATGQILAHGLATLAAHVESDRPALVIYNALSWPRSGLVTLTRSQLASLAGSSAPASGWELIDLATGETVAWQQDPAEGEVTFLADGVPAHGYKLFSARRGAGGGLTPVRTASDRIENDHYRIIVNPNTGNILSLYDKNHGRELVYAGGELRFNQLVKGIQPQRVIWGNWTPVPAGETTIWAEIGPVMSRLIIERAESPLSQTIITLPAGVPRVDIENTLLHDRTEYAGHSINSLWYDVAMPFARGEGRFSGFFQGPNGWPMPQQDWIPGTTHNVRLSRHGLDLRAANGFGVTLANRESYVSSIGSYAFWSTGQPSEPTLFFNLFARADEAFTPDQGWIPFESWEPGAPRVYTFKFSLTSSTGGFDPLAAEQFSGGFVNPLLVAGVAQNAEGPLPGPAGGLITLSQPNVVVATLKRADFENPDGGDLILRLQEIAGLRATNVVVTLPFNLEWAELNGLGEQREGATPLPADPLEVSLSPYQTLTIRLRPAR